MFTIIHSPIEFVLIGPWEGRDMVLARSDNAGLDLLGFAVQKGIAQEPRAYSGSSLGPYRYLNVVESYPVDSMQASSEKRKASYRLVWEGYCSPMSRERINESFDTHVADIQSAIKSKSLEQIEWSVAPVVYLCTRAAMRRRARRRLMLFSFLAYALILLLVLIFWLVTH
jgi:hypothetical protein